MSNNIDITGMYNTNPNTIDRSSLMKNMISRCGNSIFNINVVNIDIATMAYDIYIYVYTIFSVKSRNTVGYKAALLNISVELSSIKLCYKLSSYTNSKQVIIPKIISPIP